MASTFCKETMVTKKALKTLLSNHVTKSSRLFLVDTSGPHSQGYSFTLVRQSLREFVINEDGDKDSWWVDSAVVAVSHSVFHPEAINNIGGKGAYGTAFLKVDVAEALTC